MRTPGIIFILSLLIILAAIGNAIPAILNAFPPQPWSFQNIYGDAIEIYGSGTYRNDSVFSALGFLSQDIIMLFLVIPLLILCMVLYLKRKEKAAGPGLMALIGFILYAYSSLSLSAYYNHYFLLYILAFSASFYTLILLFGEVQLSVAIVKKLPNKFPGIFLIVSGVITLIIWGVPLILAVFDGLVPGLVFHYTTLVTHALDLAIIVPASIVGGILILKRNAVGYKIAFPLLGIIIFLLPVILLSSYLQYKQGVIFSPAEVAGPITGFLLLGLLGIWIMIKILRILKKNDLKNLSS
ncbi:hypothetical protein FHG64_11615 [Antarcticibacterium flavum]|uniref:Uncharacterized protein n=1 Tax=Antarcticibacterium flavum TaxID=2058175 RepID=A0A5B7X5S3_9FLAO|nr:MULTISPECIES: hypothetical protein [Antarcticibacterium]MCM4161556.1 hypothetical protein [Antarcticibacterium sp. W02-3]QCY69993.1 hypothetical protein FHG64_11615 [Antarcticibacterium flavum]